MKRIQYLFVAGAALVGMLLFSSQLSHAESAAGSKPQQGPPGPPGPSGPAGPAGTGGAGWDGGNEQVAFGQGGALTGTPALIWDGGVSQLVFAFTGMMDGGIIFPPNSDYTIFFNGGPKPDGGFWSSDDEYMQYSSNLTSGLIMRTNNLDIGHASGLAGNFTCDGKADIAAARATYIEFDSDNVGNYFKESVLGNNSSTGLAILPKGSGNVMIGTTNDDGVHLLQVDGGISTNMAKDQPAFTAQIGSRICLDSACHTRFAADAGSDTLIGGAGGLYVRSDTIDASLHANPSFVFDGYGPDNTSPISNANLVEFRNAGALEFAINSGGGITSSGVQLNAGVVVANELLIGANSPLLVTGNSNDGSGAIAVKLGNEGGALSTAGAKLVAICNGSANACSSKVATIDFNGVYAGGGIHLTNSTYAGTITLPSSTTGTATVVSGCKPICINTTTPTAIQCSVSSTTLTATELAPSSDAINYICF